MYFLNAFLSTSLYVQVHKQELLAVYLESVILLTAAIMVDTFHFSASEKVVFTEC